MAFSRSKAEMDARVRAVIEGEKHPGEALRGCLSATARTTFSGKTYAIGVTDQRLIMVPLDRKFEPSGDITSIAPADITKSSVDGFGGGLSHFLTTELGDIRLDTTHGTFKLMALGGGMDQLFVGEGQKLGKQAFLQFLYEARNGPAA